MSETTPMTCSKCHRRVSTLFGDECGPCFGSRDILPGGSLPPLPPQPHPLEAKLDRIIALLESVIIHRTDGPTIGTTNWDRQD